MAKLKTTKKILQLILDSTPVSLIMVDLEGKMALVNSSAEMTFGYKKKELLGKPIEILIPPPLRQQHVKNRNEYLIKPEPRYMGKGRDLYALRKDEGVFPAEIGLNPLTTEEGLFIICTVIDITARKKTEEKLVESEKKYRQLYEGSLDGYVLVDMNSRLLAFNRAFQNMLGYSEEELFALTYAKRTPQKWHAMERKIIKEDVLKKGHSKIYEKEYLKKDGVIIPVELRTYLVKDSAGKPAGMWAFVRDITDRKKSEEDLQHLQDHVKAEKRKLEQVLNIDQRISSILELNHLVDFVIEKATQILEVEKCSLMLLDAESQELLIRGAVGLNNEIIKSARIKLGEQIAGLVAKEGKPLLINDIEKIVSRKNRVAYRNKSFLSVPIKLHNKLIGVVNVADKKSKRHTEFTEDDLKILSMIIRQAAIAIENANYCRKLEYLTISDPLTEIYNHRYFIKSLDQEIHRSKRYASPLCLMMIDIDDFKTYNDTHGHPQGDHLLKEVGRTLKRTCRVVDIVCRYAGDEFVVILPETDLSQAQIVAGRLTNAFTNLNVKSKVTACVGIALFSKTTDRRDLILKADQALYRAKKKGKGEICW